MKIVLTFLAMIGFTVIANLLLKTGAVAGSPEPGAQLTHLLNWRVFVGLVSFGVAAQFRSASTAYSVEPIKSLPSAIARRGSISSEVFSLNLYCKAKSVL